MASILKKFWLDYNSQGFNQKEGNISNFNRT